MGNACCSKEMAATAGAEEAVQTTRKKPFGVRHDETDESDNGEEDFILMKPMNFTVLPKLEEHVVVASALPPTSNSHSNKPPSLQSTNGQGDDVENKTNDNSEQGAEEVKSMTPQPLPSPTAGTIPPVKGLDIILQLLQATSEQDETN